MKIQNVAVFGAGSIGVAWAVLFSCAGLRVTMYDPDGRRRDAAQAELDARLEDLVFFSLVDEKPGDISARIRIVGDSADALDHADYVQECVPEDLALKRDAFRLFQSIAPAHAILASSSSAIPISQVAAHLPGRARCLVVHPGNPPYLLRVAELVPATFTDAAIVATTEAFLSGIGMIPVTLTREIEGFVFNRLQGALLREAYCLVRDGIVTVGDLDNIVKHGLGFRWSVTGPFETADLNTRGGIEAHARKLGPAYARMGAERGQDDPWTENLVATIAAQRRESMPIEQWGERVHWRDKMLMMLMRERKQIGLGPKMTAKARHESGKF